MFNRLFTKIDEYFTKKRNSSQLEDKINQGSIEEDKPYKKSKNFGSYRIINKHFYNNEKIDEQYNLNSNFSDTSIKPDHIFKSKSISTPVCLTKYSSDTLSGYNFSFANKNISMNSFKFNADNIKLNTNCFQTSKLIKDADLVTISKSNKPTSFSNLFFNKDKSIIRKTMYSNKKNERLIIRQCIRLEEKQRYKKLIEKNFESNSSTFYPYSDRKLNTSFSSNFQDDKFGFQNISSSSPSNIMDYNSTNNNIRNPEPSFLDNNNVLDNFKSFDYSRKLEKKLENNSNEHSDSAHAIEKDVSKKNFNDTSFNSNISNEVIDLSSSDDAKSSTGEILIEDGNDNIINTNLKVQNFLNSATNFNEINKDQTSYSRKLYNIYTGYSKYNHISYKNENNSINPSSLKHNILPNTKVFKNRMVVKNFYKYENSSNLIDLTEVESSSTKLDSFNNNKITEQLMLDNEDKICEEIRDDNAQLQISQNNNSNGSLNKSKKLSDFEKCFKESKYKNSKYLQSIMENLETKLRNTKIKETECELKFLKQDREKEDLRGLEKISSIMRISKRIPPPLKEFNNSAVDSSDDYDSDDLELIEESTVIEEFPKLTKEQEESVNKALRCSRADQVLVDCFRLQITAKDIQTLDGLNWLNDEVINFYMNLIMERGKQTNFPKVYAFNTFFYPKIMSEGHKSVKRWTKTVDIFTYQYLLVPVHLGLHWCLAVVDFVEKQVSYYDSMCGNNQKCLVALLDYISKESIDKKQQTYNTSSWKQIICKDIPQQMNGSDCGVYACKFAEYISCSAPITFSQKNMPYFRRRMIWEILNKKLM